MAFNTHLSLASWNLALNAALAALNGGFIEIYTGVQPATPDTSLSGNTLLVTCNVNATAFAAATGGLATANTVSTGVAGATGTATWFRCYRSDGVTAVLDGSAGTAGTDLVLVTASIVAGASVPITSWTVSCPAGQ